MSDNQYIKWGKKWEVLQSKCGAWYAGCKRTGYSTGVLDKLGTEPTAYAMQGKLDAWAKRNGARLAGYRPAEQMRFF